MAIGEPIATTGYSIHTKEALMVEVRNALHRQLTAA
jgi:hypothetical protein